MVDKSDNKVFLKKMKQLNLYYFCVNIEVNYLT